MQKLAAIAILCVAVPLAAQEKPAAPASPKPAAPSAQKPVAAPAAKSSDASAGKTVEEIIARVNNEIITRSEYERSRLTAEEDARNECENRCTSEQLKVDIEDRQKNSLRDLIDQSLLVQRGKDMGVSVEPDLIKRMDAIRIQNKLGSMEELEKAVTGAGTNWEDFKNNIRNTLLTQRVISSEVGSHVNVTDSEVTKYYEDHKKEFVRPEQVALRANPSQYHQLIRTILSREEFPNVNEKVIDIIESVPCVTFVDVDKIVSENPQWKENFATWGTYFNTYGTKKQK